MEISSQETGLDRKWASGISQYSCAQLAMAVTTKRIYHARGRHERQRVVPGKRTEQAMKKLKNKFASLLLTHLQYKINHYSY